MAAAYVSFEMVAMGFEWQGGGGGGGGGGAGMGCEVECFISVRYRGSYQVLDQHR